MARASTGLGKTAGAQPERASTCELGQGLAPLGPGGLHIATLSVLVAVFVAVLAVALGVVLAFVPSVSRGAIGPLRTFATAAAMAVVVGHLAPEAFEQLGVVAVPVFFAGLFLPTGLHWLRAVARRGRASDDDAARVKLEVSYVGLLVHHVGDGLGLGAYAGPYHDGHSHVDVLVALAAHTVPLVAVVALAYRRALGSRVALMRSGGLIVASLIGVLLSALVSAEFVTLASGWIAAVVSGLLLHVVTHDLDADLPEGALSRGVDLLFAALGIAIGVFGAGEHADAHVHAQVGTHLELSEALLAWAHRAAPAVLLGLMLSVFLRRALPSVAARFRSVKSEVARGLHGVVVGSVSSACASDSLHEPPLRLGLSRGSLVSYFLSARSLGVATLVLSLSLFGVMLGAARWVLALLVVICGTLAYVATSRNQTVDSSSGAISVMEAQSFDRAFDDVTFHVTAWLVIGLVVAGILDSGLGAGALTPSRGAPLELVLAIFGVLLLQVSTLTLVPVGAVLLAKGVSAGAIVAALLIAGTLNRGSVATLSRTFGQRTALVLVGSVVLVTLLAGFATNELLGVEPGAAVSNAAFSWSSAGSLAAIVLGVLVVYSVWSKSFRGWLTAISHEH